MGVPTWISKKLKSRTRILESDFDPSKVLTVAADGTGNFTTITDAINFAPNNSNDKTHIYVKQGLYEENVEIPSYKTHIVLLGDGADITTITGKRSVGDGWTTFRSATLVYLNSHIDSFINPAGWTQWSDDNDDQELKTLYYGEYDNDGPSSSTDDRVQWKGYHKMDVDATYNFTVSEFISGDEWLDSTAFPYDHRV
ncbi:putative pectinesterase/pectinesterase inhibitor 12 [Quercus suber]|uniref:Pectinesterase/pectinesterase inhibitor 12 n=1 Tax=Quercus suber TaxID=58331 RepID=A0AAW0L3T8_QUESU